LTLAQLRPLFDKYGIQPTKRFGQNFLIDQNHLRRVVDTAQVEAGDCVLEIGPGAGSLTKALAEKGARVLALELDPYLLPLLGEVLAPYPNATVLQTDALKEDLGVLLPRHFGEGKPVKVVANIPYNITSPLLIQFLTHTPKFASITLMVQREVAERLRAAPDTDNYGALTLFAQFYASVTLAAIVPKQSFLPPPKVDSAIIHLVPHATPPVEVPTPESFFTLTRAAFGQRRKTLNNALQSVVEKEKLQEALERVGIDGIRRGETLGASEYAALARFLHLQEIAVQMDTESLARANTPTRALVVANCGVTHFTGRAILHADFAVRESLPVTVFAPDGTLVPSRIVNETREEISPDTGKFRWVFDLEFYVENLPSKTAIAYAACWAESAAVLAFPENAMDSTLAYETECRVGEFANPYRWG
jgi:16S rRNA (adenine1518-N6/adenine1519-N6)-dimethyltransferase